MARVITIWGLAAVATALAVGPNSFYLIRSILRVAETGFFARVIFLPVHVASSTMPGQCAHLVHACCTVVLADRRSVPTVLLRINDWLGLKDWQRMFIIEGLPVCVLSFVTLKLLVDKPADANWLTKEERLGLQQMAAADMPGSRVATRLDRR